MCVDDGEGWRELDREVGVVSDRVEVEEWDVQSGRVLLDEREV